MALNNTPDLQGVFEKMKGPGGVTVKDRKWRLKTFPQCFIGKEAIDWLVKNQKFSDREKAVNLAQAIMDEGLISHVVEDQYFEDKLLYYCFNTPEVAKKLMQERKSSSKEGWLEKKAFIGSTKLWCELRGHILRAYTQPKGKLKEKYNIENCKLKETPKDIQLKLQKGGTIILIAEDENTKKDWVSKLTLGKSRGLDNDILKQYESIGDVGKDFIQEITADEPPQLSKSSSESNMNTSDKKTEDLTTNMEPQGEENGEENAAEAFSDLMKLPVKDMDGNSKSFAEIFENKEICAIALLRHFG